MCTLEAGRGGGEWGGRGEGGVHLRIALNLLKYAQFYSYGTQTMPSYLKYASDPTNLTFTSCCKNFNIFKRSKLLSIPKAKSKKWLVLNKQISIGDLDLR